MSRNYDYEISLHENKLIRAGIYRKIGIGVFVAGILATFVGSFTQESMDNFRDVFFGGLILSAGVLVFSIIVSKMLEKRSMDKLYELTEEKRRHNSIQIRLTAEDMKNIEKME